MVPRIRPDLDQYSLVEMGGGEQRMGGSFIRVFLVVSDERIDCRIRGNTPEGGGGPNYPNM